MMCKTLGCKRLDKRDCILNGCEVYKKYALPLIEVKNK